MSSAKIDQLKIMTFAAADAELGGVLAEKFQNEYETVLLVPGDLELDGEFLPALKKRVQGDFDIVAVKGDLKVAGRICLYDDNPGLWVGGSTTAETLEGGDTEIYVQGGSIAYFIYGEYNHGVLETGEIKAPWVINSDHHLDVPESVAAKRINNFDDDPDSDFGTGTIAAAFVPEVIGGEDKNEIDIDKFYKRLAAGKPVLKQGAKTDGARALDAMAKAKSAGRTELVMANKKLKSFPANALEMTGLRKLVLDGNAIKKVPKEIAKLVYLEELSLVECKLEEIPDEIGELKNLRKLRIGKNITYAWNKDERIVKPIRVPTSIGDLANLEELDVSLLSDDVSGQDDEPLPDMTPFELPATLANCKKLRVLIATGTNLVLPKAVWGMPSLEVLVLSGGSAKYLKEFPPYIETFRSLRKLDVNGNFFRVVPSLAGLANLEELDLGSALGLLKQLPQLSGLAKLRVLNLDGNSGRTNVPVPKHDILKPFFQMKLPALEDLRLDRWGEEEDWKRSHMPSKLLTGIGGFRKLRKLDLQFNGLKEMPADFYELTDIESLNLDCNRFGKKELAKIQKVFPKAQIEIGDQE